MRTLIIQVARLDRNYQEKISFKYNDITSNEYSITSIFFKENVIKESCDILFIFPLSLPIQTFNHTEDDFINKCNAINIDEYLKNPLILVKSHPHIIHNNFLIVPSIGKCKKDKEYEFNSNLETIILRVLLHLYKNYLTIEQLFIDISGGHNIYNISIINAIYQFLPIYELYYNLEKKLLTKIIYADPIVPGIKTTYNINVSDFSIKAFFEIPYKEINEIQTLIQKKVSNNEKKDILNFYKIYFPALFYAVKNSFLLLIPKLIKCSNKMLELNEPNLDEDLKDYFNAYIQILFANAIFNGIINVFKNFPETIKFSIIKTLENNKEITEIEIDGETNYEQAFHKFGALSMYKKFKAELKNLAQEIDIDKIKDLNDFSDNFLKDNYKRNTQFNPRNFVAHSGLEKNSILIKSLKICENKYELEIKLKDDIFNKLENIINECKK